MSKEYITVYESWYDEKGRVVTKDLITGEILDLEKRPDVKQRAEKGINSEQYLATYKRGSRKGFIHIPKEEVGGILEQIRIQNIKKDYKSIQEQEPIFHGELRAPVSLDIPKPNKSIVTGKPFLEPLL